MQIVAVESAEQLDAVRRLFEEYWASFGFTPCFQNFAGELAALPGEYVPPGGTLVLAMVDGEAAGCGALRRIDTERVEAKRLYVRPSYRGQGLGPALLEWLIEHARYLGYREMLGDTMPVMERALALYDRYGFERVPPYAKEPTPGAIYLKKELGGRS
jgi:GNAT superfamily N-acetyltransferase